MEHSNNHNQQHQQQKSNGNNTGGNKRTLFGRRPLYIKKTSLKRIKNLTNEQQQQQQQQRVNRNTNTNSPKILLSPTSCSTSTSSITSTSTTTFGINSTATAAVLASLGRDSSHSVASIKSNRSISNRSSAVSPFPKQSIMNDGKGKANHGRFLMSHVDYVGITGVRI